eukprot:CAMPEP_0118656284 /NCGR_PEP_ID=MMETSP0785-20121206/13412_1 /TAXON_ID=91992 /ORGANISM="Bolidomonas pacifica, Strain CCMP 1866" /LENGTH=1072 /DNA_ID=CAMNT_0006549143 /DNA_START=173 /DNA_END=3388 /DNA_ORIENTATION=+
MTLTTLMIVCVFLLACITAAQTQPDFLKTDTNVTDSVEGRCTMKDVESANNLQLGIIMKNLRDRDFFRWFSVDLDVPCNFWKEAEEFVCSGGDDDASSTDELAMTSSMMDSASMFPSEEPDDEPLCGVTSQPSFDFEPTSDPIITNEKKATLAEDCSDPTKENFWVDICTGIDSEGPSKSNIDLHANEEHNTYYNGSHIWSAIYDDNCVGSDGGMCYEETVLYRLLSGIHSSTTISIAKHYYPPSKKKNRTSYEPNPSFAIQAFSDHPEYVRNLHFTYVFLLRALKKASPFLSSYNYNTGNATDDMLTEMLVRRLTESSILDSCSSVFGAFDESLMFTSSPELKTTFKSIFHNVSSIVDCVQCQQCKLHAKMSLLGLGAGMKMLFLENIDDGSISRNEVVAFINTLGKVSESITDIRELSNMYWEENSFLIAPERTEEAREAKKLPFALTDSCVSAVKQLSSRNLISSEQEISLAKEVLNGNVNLLAICKHYSDDPMKFLRILSNSDFYSSSKIDVATHQQPPPDAIVVGTGLAGLAATLTILDNGGRVVLVEKETRMGGNSAKASSGINACCPHNDTHGDSRELFKADTTKSAGQGANPGLIDVLVSGSEEAVKWLKERVNVDLSQIAQLGGHSAKRTNRPSNGMAGAEIIYGMQRAVKEYEKQGRVEILMGRKVVNLIETEEEDTEGKVVAGVTVVDLATNSTESFFAPSTILATGGFASDRSKGSYLDKYRPDLMAMPATAGDFSTGDGVALATSLGAGVVGMDKVQLHPTGWVDPKDPSSGTKILAAELMRGVGGLLINSEGKRFVNEVSTRSNVTHHMLMHDPVYKSEGVWDVNREVPTFWLVLSEEAAKEGRKHVDLYTHKGLMKEVKGLKGLAKETGTSEKNLKKTYEQYSKSAKVGSDEFGKTVFRGLSQNLKGGKFYVGKVTSVLHYCMGGVTIDEDGRVLGEEGIAIGGLWAAGEVAGGVHGDNRLGGNSLLECTVFGRKVGGLIDIADVASGGGGGMEEVPSPDEDMSAKVVSMEEVAKHDKTEDCWVALHGYAYDLTSFAEEHPPGPESIHELCGKDGTE